MNAQTNLKYDQRREHFHLLPGRLRMSVPGLLNNQALATILARRLSKVSGVKAGFVNPVSGRVLIYFEPNSIDLHLLITLLRRSSPPRILQKDLKRHPAHSLRQPAPINRSASSHSHEIPWHTLTTSQAISILGSNIKTGLSSSIARERLQKYGYNELLERPRPSIWQIALESLKGFMTQLLLVAGGISLLVGETTDAAVIVAIVILQAAVEAVQSKRAEKSLAALKELSAPFAAVFRDGTVLRIPARELVPGDIILLEAGDKVPADARIVETTNLTTNEACLTGESVPVVKDNIIRKKSKMSIVDQENMLFSGTSITGGRSLAIVVSTGMKTEMGKIAILLSQVETEQTNLQKQLELLGKKITKLVVVSVGVIATVNLLQGRSIWEVLRTAISLAVGAVPEGLPAVLTVALATGVQRMVKRNAVVRRLSAVESLGSATVICTDKTGTLTKNEMTVKEVFINHNYYEFTGNGYQPFGNICLDGQKISGITPNLERVLKTAALCSNAELKFDTKGNWNVTGDPTEGALLTAAAKAGLWWQDLKAHHRRHKEIAFDSNRRMMTVVCEEPGGDLGVYIKGAPDTVIDYCSHFISSEDDQLLDLRNRRKILAVNDFMAGKALRVLATAYKTLPAGTDLEQIDLESDLIFCGLIGMEDPPRDGVREAIQKCRGAGVHVVMITGDHQKTAEAIAAKLGILDQGTSITGEELEMLSNQELEKRVEGIVVYSRTSPEQKLRIVQALKRRGQIVAMTGDGVNDAPAIKEADIGIAMGLSGTDVTREAAGITLSDDNFVTIVNGIEEGRTVSLNLSKSVRYILSGSLGQLLAVFTTATVGLPTPLLPPQILWVNLVTESLPAMSLTADPPQPNCMRQPPLNPAERFLPDKGRAIIRRGILTGITTFGVYAAGLEFGGWSLNKARTMAFSQLVMGRIFNLINERKKKDEGTPGFKDNPLILPAAAMSALMLAITMYLPFMRPFFSTVPIGLPDWGILIANAFVSGKIDSLLASAHKKAPLYLPAPASHTQRTLGPSLRSPYAVKPVIESDFQQIHDIS